MRFTNQMSDQLDPWVRKIVNAATRVLEEKGLLAPQPEVQRQLPAFAGITADGQRLRFGAQLTDDFLSRYRQSHPFTDPEEFSLGTIGHAHHIVGVEGDLRPITLADVEQGTRLIDALADLNIFGSAPGIPQDVPPPLQGLAQLIAGAKFSRGYPACSLRTELKAEQYVLECYQALGFSYSPGVHLVSPLKFEGQEVELALQMRQKVPEVPIGVGTMPVLGVSAPASVLSGFVVALAEVLGGGMIFERLGTPIEKLGLFVNAYPFDMRHGSFVYGSPANVVCTVVERELNRLLGTEISAKSFNVTAQLPGPQAAAQKGLFTGMMVSLGKRVFSGGGSLSVDEIYSPVQLIYDREIFSYVKRTAQMLEEALNDDRLLVDEILEEATGSFLDTESTARLFRHLQWDSDVFPCRMLAQWQTAGCPLELDTAVEEANRLTTGHTYQLTEDKARALDAIYARASRDLLG